MKTKAAVVVLLAALSCSAARAADPTIVPFAEATSDTVDYLTKLIKGRPETAVAEKPSQQPRIVEVSPMNLMLSKDKAASLRSACDAEGPGFQLVGESAIVQQFALQLCAPTDKVAGGEYGYVMISVDAEFDKLADAKGVLDRACGRQGNDAELIGDEKLLGGEDNASMAYVCRYRR